MTEPIRAPLSISRQALPAFFELIKTRYGKPLPFVPDDKMYYSEDRFGFRLRIFTLGIERNFKLIGNFVGDGERLHLDWKLDEGVPALIVPIFGGMIVFFALLFGLLSKDGPVWFILLWAALVGPFLYFHYHGMLRHGEAAQKKYLETVQECIDEAEKSLMRDENLTHPGGGA